MRNIYKICILATLLLFVACSADSADSGGQSSIQVGLMPDITSVPFIIAEQQGFLPENVTLEVFRAAADRDAALHSGLLDVVVSDMIALHLNNQGGFEGFAIMETFSSFGLVAHPSSGVTSVAELHGADIGLSLNTIIEYMVDRFLTMYGINPSDVEKVSVPQIPQRFELLEAGHITAAAMPEPFPSAAVAAGLIRLADSYQEGIRPGVLIAMADAHANKTAELLDLLDAYNRAVEFINATDSAEFMPSIVEIMGLPDAAYDFVVPTMEFAQNPSADEFYLVQNWMLNNGLLETPFDFDDLVRPLR
ncbi:MAG: MetQ/NlpA family ABC transporter substrate-binding protein [Firmicutes bacterium]|nr:MetQ/NlpA family ABC transporter substrate-binding protein [Bacillota bacterium]